MYIVMQNGKLLKTSKEFRKVCKSRRIRKEKVFLFFSSAELKGELSQVKRKRARYGNEKKEAFDLRFTEKTFRQKGSKEKMQVTL